MGICGNFRENRREKKDSQVSSIRHDESNIRENRNVNNNIEQKKDSNDNDNKEEERKKYVKKRHFDNNRANKMSEKFVYRAIGSSAAGIISAPFIEPKINNNNECNNDNKINNDINTNNYNENYNINDLNDNKNLFESKEVINDPYKKINEDMLIKNNYEDNLNNYEQDTGHNYTNDIFGNNLFENKNDIMNNYNNGNLMTKFNEFDLNKDNKLDNQEIMEGLNMPLNQADQLIKNFDLNGDGFLDQNEINQIPSNDLGFF